MPLKAPVKKKAPQRHGSAKPRMPRRSSAASIRALAAALGRSEAACRKWTSRADWPFGAPPWSIEKVREWALVALSPDPAAALHDRLANAERAVREADMTETPISARWKAELLQIIARTRLLTQEYQRRDGSLHDTATCQARRVRQILAVKEKFLSLPRILAPRLVGLTRDEIERLLLAEIEAVCNAFAAEAP